MGSWSIGLLAAGILSGFAVLGIRSARIAVQQRSPEEQQQILGEMSRLLSGSDGNARRRLKQRMRGQDWCYLRRQETILLVVAASTTCLGLVCLALA
jgi:hypothetical protein